MSFENQKPGIESGLQQVLATIYSIRDECGQPGDPTITEVAAQALLVQIGC